MPKFRIEITSTKTEIYEIEAENKDEAIDLYGLGHYIGSKDENSDLMEVKEIS